MNHEQPLMVKKQRSVWVTLSIVAVAIGGLIAIAYAVIAILPMLLVMFLFSSASDAAKDHKPEPALIAYKDKVSEAVQQLHPATGWTQLSSDVRLPRECDFWKGYYDCVMYEATWDTNLPYHEGMTTEVASELGAFTGNGRVGEQDMTGSSINPVPAYIEVDGVRFVVSVGDTGVGTNAIIKVTSSKPGTLPAGEPSGATKR